jgi:carbamoyl-phosphate synthase large subunit
VYFVPVTPEFVTRIIAEEKPDAISVSFGGQTALNCGIKLYDTGVLAEHGVRVLGTPIEAVRRTEDRALFNKELRSIGVPVPRSIPCTTHEEAMRAPDEVGFPLVRTGRQRQWARAQPRRARHAARQGVR